MTRPAIPAAALAMLDPESAALIQRARESRPLYVSPAGVAYSFANPTRGDAIASKHGGTVHSPLREHRATRRAYR